MLWLSLRLQRTELVLLIFSAVAIGLAFASTHDDIRDVSRLGPQPSCGVSFRYIAEGGYCPDGTSSILPLVSEAVPYAIFVPLGVAIVMVLPFVMELSARSYRLAWVQCGSRAQWLRSRLLVILVICLSLTGTTILLARWWLPVRPVFESIRGFDVWGIVNLGWAVFAVGVALATGTLWRRPLVMIFATGLVYVATRVTFISYLRPVLLSPDRLMEPVPAVGALGQNVWVTGSWYQRPDGSRVSDQAIFDLCRDQGSNQTADWLEPCLQANGLTTRVWEYHPDSHYWPMQLIETGLFTAIGLVLIGGTAWYWLRRLE